MKRLFKPLSLTTVVLLLLIISSTPALALPPGVEGVLGKITPPPQVSSLGFGAAGISRVLSNIIIIIFIVAAILFLFMVVISAIQWIISGGDKEAVAKARSRLTYAIIGIVLLALSFLILRVIGQITGFSFFKGQVNIPTTPATGEIIRPVPVVTQIQRQLPVNNTNQTQSPPVIQNRTSTGPAIINR